MLPEWVARYRLRMGLGTTGPLMIHAPDEVVEVARSLDLGNVLLESTGTPVEGHTSVMYLYPEGSLVRLEDGMLDLTPLSGWRGWLWLDRPRRWWKDARDLGTLAFRRR